MALLRDAIFKRPLTLPELLALERKKINLKPLKKLTVRFDPFDNNVVHVRKFNHWIHESDIVKTNPKCLIKTEILTDRSEPHVVFDLNDGKQFIFKCTNLKCLEIFQLMNKYITPLAPEDDLMNVSQMTTRKKK